MSGTKLFVSVVMLVGLPAMAMLRQEDGQFTLREHDQEYSINRYDVHPFLRNMAPDQLAKFQRVGNRIRASRLDNGDFVVRPHAGLKGGGPGWGCVVALVGYTSVGIAALGTLIVTAPSGPGCVAAAAGVAMGGCAAVTKAVIVVTGMPTP